jgi:competence protein ComGC
MIVLAIIAIIAAFAIPNLMKSRMSANETSAIGSLRALMSAEGTYINKYNIYGTLDQLYAEGLIDGSVANGRKSGYLFGELNTTDYSYCFCACPAEDLRSGEKEYILTQKGTIYEANFDTTTVGADWEGDFTTKWDLTDNAWSEGGYSVGDTWLLNPEADRDTWTPISE